MKLHSIALCLLGSLLAGPVWAQTQPKSTVVTRCVTKKATTRPASTPIPTTYAADQTTSTTVTVVALRTRTVNAPQGTVTSTTTSTSTSVTTVTSPGLTQQISTTVTSTATTTQTVTFTSTSVTTSTIHSSTTSGTYTWPATVIPVRDTFPRNKLNKRKVRDSGRLYEDKRAIETVDVAAAMFPKSALCTRTTSKFIYSTTTSFATTTRTLPPVTSTQTAITSTTSTSTYYKPASTTITFTSTTFSTAHVVSTTTTTDTVTLTQVTVYPATTTFPQCASTNVAGDIRGSQLDNVGVERDRFTDNTVTSPGYDKDSYSCCTACLQFGGCAASGWFRYRDGTTSCELYTSKNNQCSNPRQYQDGFYAVVGSGSGATVQISNGMCGNWGDYFQY